MRVKGLPDHEESGSRLGVRVVLDVGFHGWEGDYRGDVGFGVRGAGEREFVHVRDPVGG